MSLRMRIVLLVLLATLTPAALVGVNLFANRDQEIAKAEQSLHALAVYAADDLGDKVSGTVQLLHGLSRAPDLDSGDRQACSEFLNEVLQRYPQYTGLLTISPDGQLDCDSLRSGRTLDLRDRAYFRAARASAQPAFEPAFGRLTGIAVMQVAYPARGRDGKLKYVLLASLNLAQFGARVAAASAYQGMEMVIWDGKGTIMVRHPDGGAQKLAGSTAADSVLYRFARSAQLEHAAEMAGPDGTQKIWALGVPPARVGGDLRITLGVPRDVLIAEVDLALRRGLGILATVSLLAFLGALLLAEIGIRRQVARIAVAAARQGRGDFTARIGAPYPRGELGGLMATLDATAASVQVQQSEIERASEELRRSNRVLKVLRAINSTIVRVHDRDELLAEACRIAAEEGQFPIVWAGVLDRDSMQVQPVAWQGVNRAYVEAVPRSVAENTGGIVGRALRERHAVVVNDVAADLRLVMRTASLELGSRAIAVLPLIVSGEAAGVLVLHSRETGFFDTAEMKLLNELAGDVAFALESIAKSERVHYLSYYDSLTGLANRALFHERLDQFLSMAKGEHGGIAVVVGDIERFKAINDALGRPAGDELLRQIAARGSRTVGDKHLLARIGADQFAFIVLDEAEPEGVARRVEQWHREVFGEPFQLGAAEQWVSLRIGIALFPDDGADADSLLRNAEAALNKSKAMGERFLFYVPQMNERVAEKLALENKLRLALQREEFVLHYQPKLDLQTRRIVGVEALIRWRSPELGLVPPMQFIPLLEETGLIQQVGEWALRRAANDHRAWVNAGIDAPRVAVNVSAIQLRQRDFVRDLERAIGAGVSPTGVDVEITESLMMADIEDNIRKLKEIRALGLAIAIDDFGTGYSSLAWLAKLPLQSLKIDRSFIISMLGDPDAMTMVEAIVSLAHALRLTVVAEGVDAPEQEKALRLIGCDQMQGFLFSRPVPWDELLALLRQH